MPAITVDNILVLPRVPEPDVTAGRADGHLGHHRARRATRARASRSGARSPGWTWRGSTRSSTWTRWVRSTTGPVSPRARRGTRTAGSRPSPTSSTATFQHQDSNGGGGLITNGDTQWMTAGAGMLHIEAPPEELVVSGGLFHGFQLWVNLPRAHEDDPAALPGHPGGAGRAAVLARTAGRCCGSSPGEVGGHAGPGVTHTPITLVHATVSPGAQVTAAVAGGLQRARLRARPGSGTVGRGGAAGRTGQLAVFGAGRRA